MRIRQAAILFGAVTVIVLLALVLWHFTKQRPIKLHNGTALAAKAMPRVAGKAGAPGQPGTSIPHTPTAHMLHTTTHPRKRNDHRVAARWMSPSQARKIKLPHGFHLAQIPWTGGLRHDTLPPNVTSRAPPLDRQRQAADQTNAASGNTHITFASNFSCGTPVKVKRVSATHYILTFTGSEAQAGGDGKDHYWFLLRLTGVKGKTVRLDMSNVDIKYWQFLNPVYGYCHNLNNPKNFVCKPVSHGRAQFGYNGPILPDTSGQKWHFIVNVWREGTNLCLVQKFTHNHVYLAMHYPYTPKLNEAYMARLQGNPYCRVVTVGQSKDGRPLLAVEIPRPGNTPADKAKPCVLIYAREVADEQDGSWISQGAIRFLLSSSPQAQAIRRSVQFIIIPLLDPDAAAASQHYGIALDFNNGLPLTGTKESNQYADFCQHWVNSGHGIDLAIAIDGSEPSGKPDFYCPDAFPDVLQHRTTDLLLVRVAGQVRSAGYSASERAERYRRFGENTLVGWLAGTYGTLLVPLDINAQNVYHHLVLCDIRRVGAALVYGEARFLGSKHGEAWRLHIQRLLVKRAMDWKRYGAKWIHKSALVSEQRVRWAARNVRINRLITEQGLTRVAESHVSGWSSTGDPW